MHMSFRRNTGDVLEAIKRVLTPYVGKLMASTAAAAHCQELGLQGLELNQDQIEALLKKLGLGLIVFIGKDKAASVVAAMRSEIENLREPAA